MDSKKFKGGSSCAVATCTNYSSKLKNAGIAGVSFYRFPKDPDIQKEWALKCKRIGKWNPNTAAICSDHFTSDDYERNLKAELLGYTPNIKKLKRGAIPSLNMPESYDQLPETTIKLRKKMKSKISKRRKL